MPASHISGLFLALFVAGCACVGERLPSQAAATPAAPVAAEPPRTSAANSEAVEVQPAGTNPAPAAPVVSKPAETSPPLSVAPPVTAVVSKPAETPPPQSKTPEVKPSKTGPTQALPAKPAARPATPPASASAGQSVAIAPRATVSPAAAEPAQKKEVAPAPSMPAAPPPMDLTLLEKKLRDTNAIGMMTKITIKNQVDELLDRFRAYHNGQAPTTPAQLRQPYDMLIMKVLSLLQDKDPSLAGSIAASREAIWSILTDRSRFSNL